MSDARLVRRWVASPLGELTLVGGDGGLRAVLWPAEATGRVPLPAVSDGSHDGLDRAAEQLAEYFAGERHEFDLLLDPVGTDFQVTVWRSLSEIPYGSTVTYGEQAARIGAPTAVRAVGSANGRNPLSIVLPCHRVVGSNGALTGFAGGLASKRFLLDLEAAHGRPTLFADR